MLPTHSPLPLFPHQSTGAERLVDRTPTYLGFDMGIGKSRTFIEAAKASNARRVLIVCPKSAILVWKREIAMWDTGALVVPVRKPADFIAGAARVGTYFLVTHGTLSQKEGDVAHYLALAPAFDMTAVDEAHAFNAPSSLRVKALRRAAAGHKLGQIVPLSGTPMRNHAGDLYNFLALCYPKALTSQSGAIMGRYDFEELFCRTAMKRFNGRQVRVIEGSKNIDQLRRLIAPFMLRVRKEDVLKDLPPILWETVPVGLDPGHLTPEDLEGLGRYASNIEAWLKPSADGHLMALRRKLGLAKLAGACEYLVDMLDNLAPSRKVLVFAVHSDVIAQLRHHLDEYDPAVITGEVTGKARADAVDKFLTKPSCRVFIGNIQAAGTALTLVGPTCRCSDVVFVESSWTPADNAQAACRVHRIGQKDGVVARMLYADSTIDNLIAGILARKAREFTQLFDTQTQGEKA